MIGVISQRKLIFRKDRSFFCYRAKFGVPQVLHFSTKLESLISALYNEASEAYKIECKLLKPRESQTTLVCSKRSRMKMSVKCLFKKFLGTLIVCGLEKESNFPPFRFVCVSLSELGYCQNMNCSLNRQVPKTT